MSYKATKKHVLILLFVISSATIFSAAEHNPLKELAESYAQTACEAHRRCALYTQCLEEEKFNHDSCQNWRDFFLKQTEQLKQKHTQLAEQTTPKQLSTITAPHLESTFNLLNPESPEHFVDVVMAKSLTSQYATNSNNLLSTKAQLHRLKYWGFCGSYYPAGDSAALLKFGIRTRSVCAELASNINNINEQQAKLEATLGAPRVAECIEQHAPEFVATHPRLFTSSTFKSTLKAIVDALPNFVK